MLAQCFGTETVPTAANIDPDPQASPSRSDARQVLDGSYETAASRPPRCAHSADFDEAKAARFKMIHQAPVAVEACRKSYGILKPEPHDVDGILRHDGVAVGTSRRPDAPNGEHHRLLRGHHSALAARRQDLSVRLPLSEK
jgi:hypothetical protein